jgi:hypothetical protein
MAGKESDMSEPAILKRRGPSWVVSDLIKRRKAMPSGAEKALLGAELDLLCETLRRLDDRFLPPYEGPSK